ncbi:hypothetical protein [Nostoc sp. MG11]|uniref:hypothetical protein n=1 Tax=Nostoc sp. MG11 TaxID=2721166 RepID=UPI001868EFF5|nr:hypothetical protein [Nostoc sp. MG11]
METPRRSMTRYRFSTRRCANAIALQPFGHPTAGVSPSLRDATRREKTGLPTLRTVATATLTPRHWLPLTLDS